MKKIELASIETFFKEHITDRNACFVFPTDVVAQSWADWCVVDSHTSVNSVALDRFIAWDKFKGSFLAANLVEHTAIPSLLRQFFVYDIIEQNKKSPIFKKIIRPEYAETAASFADWITANLPSLHLWKKRMDANYDTYGQLDDEDSDYALLYERYKEFLDANRLFEPSWVENIEFKDKSRHFYIFFPEQLADFSNFDDIFANVDNVTALLLPSSVPAPKAYFYKDARRELRQTILRMIKLVNDGKADWTEIALSIPDIETYRPYILREFSQYGIPFVLRSGVSLTQNNAGRIFNEINDCYNSDFSYESVRTLLLDECIPWKSTVSLKVSGEKEPDKFEDFDLTELREGLIRLGNEMRCICSYEKKTEDGWIKVDSWEEALGKTYKTNGKYLKMYRKLHNDVCRFFSHENISFENVRSAWFNFKANFIDENDFSSDANKILGRCLSELESIIAIEKDYADTGLTVENPFQFYLNLLNSKSYTSQSADKGISVFPYKLSAGAYFKYQFVIDGSQKNIEVPYKPLAFLNSEKRKKLKLAEDERLYNATGTIIRLYAKTSDGADENFVHFSASENTFSGFSIPHSALEIEENVPDLDDADFILAEKHWIENGAKEPMKISGSQKKQLEKWINAALEKDSDYRINEEIRKKIDYHFVESKNLSLDRKKIAVSEKCRAMNKISARSDMEKFFPCPRKWIFSQILKFQEDSLSTDLMTPYDMGSLHHKILEKFMDLYKDKALPFFNNGSFFEKNENSQELNSNNDVTLRIQNLLYGTNDEPGLVEKSIKSVSNDFSDSPLVIMTLMSQKNNIANTIMAFLENLLEPYSVESDDEMPKDISGIGNCTVVSVEDTYVSEMEKFAYYGKIDCVVKTPDTKQLVLLDYKNSTTSFPAGFKANENGILEDYQMTVYCRLLSKDCAKELAASYFYAIKDCKRLLVFDKYKENQVDSKGNPKKDENYAAFEPSVKICDEYAEIMNKIVSAESPDFSPKTSKNLKNRQNVKRYIDCAGCNYKEVCRTTYSVAGKQLKTEK